MPGTLDLFVLFLVVVVAIAVLVIVAAAVCKVTDEAYPADNPDSLNMTGDSAIGLPPCPNTRIAGQTQESVRGPV